MTGVIKRVKSLILRVYNYEKTAEIEIAYLRDILLSFALIIFVLNIVNNQGLTRVFWFTNICCFGAAVIAFGLKQFKKLKLGLILSTLFFLLSSIYCVYYGGNEGFQTLWYLLFPFFMLVLTGIPIGGVFCLIYGVVITILFWSPIANYLAYEYPKDYRMYYPLFYWAFTLVILTVDLFYKEYRILGEENREMMELEVARTVEEAQKLMVSSVAAISKMIDEKDPYTSQHSQRVAEYSRLIAKNMPDTKYTLTELDEIYRSALLHDIGKVAIPDAILNKPGRLTEEEYGIMKQHTVWGKKILEGLRFLPQADYGASYHHERFDGTGYPEGIKGRDVPEIVWIISAADALDAMNSNRCYRKQCDMSYIIDEFEKGCGTQFHPIVAKVVIRLIKEGKIKGDNH